MKNKETKIKNFEIKAYELDTNINKILMDLDRCDLPAPLMEDVKQIEEVLNLHAELIKEQPDQIKRLSIIDSAGLRELKQVLFNKAFDLIAPGI